MRVKLLVTQIHAISGVQSFAASSEELATPSETQVCISVRTWQLKGLF